VQGVVGLADAFHRDVVAEASKMAHVRMLLSIGCNVMQGYGISRPLPTEHLEPWLDASSPIPAGRIRRRPCRSTDRH
jgi:EAL domain-containing protein (putative c-di-GMP-specific phosphodiesterase class I)